MLFICKLYVNRLSEFLTRLRTVCMQDNWLFALLPMGPFTAREIVIR